MTRTERVTTAIQESWQADTTSTPDSWGPDNIARGQCVPTALVVQDYLGGEVERLTTTHEGKPETHYRNVINGEVVDLTRSQYPNSQSFSPTPVAGDIREYVWQSPDTRARYYALTRRVQQLMYLQSMALHPEDTGKLTVLFDMDGNMFDFDGRIEQELEAAGIAIPPRSDFYATNRFSDPAIQERIKTLQHSKGFFSSLQPINGAVEAWHFTESLGFHPRIASAPITSNPWSIPEKLATISTHLGPRAADEAYIGKRKSECSGIVLFDDRPEIADASEADWLHAHYTQGYNGHIATEYRIHDWTDLGHLEKVLAQAAERYIALHG